MSTHTSIEWTERTWNPTTGCTKVSPGCQHCYAETMAFRLRAMGVKGYENGFRLSLVEDRLDEPLRRHKPTMYFVNSMSDIFHEEVPDDYLNRVFDIMDRTPQHIYQLLTKRSKRLRRYVAVREVPANVWLGVSVEDRAFGVPRIADLQSINAAVRFLSAEPLLEDLGRLDLTHIHWVIVGGESGPRARPMQSEWIENIHNQCLHQGAAFFFKQWGGWGPDGKRRSKRANGRIFKNQTWDEMPKAGTGLASKSLQLNGARENGKKGI